MKFFLLIGFISMNLFAYDCKVAKNAFILTYPSSATVIAIDKIENVSATAFKGELTVTLMSGKKIDLISKNVSEIMNELITKISLRE